MKVYLETMGCQMNRLDSELVAASLRAAGLELTDDARAADVLLYNTCSVRRHAEDKVHSRLGWACQRKAGGRRIIIGVLGCMAQRMGDRLIRRHGGVDVVCGPGQLARLPELIASAADGPQVALDPPRNQARGDEPIDRLDHARDPARTHLPGQAYVRIMRGCDRFCTYCVVPFVRGPELSRRPGAILEEVRRLVGAGVTQVALLGQTVNSYRHAQSGRSVGLADLLERIDAVEGLRRVRFVTNYPGDFDRAILQAMADLPSVCEHLHLPAQSGSDRVLRAMGRRYTRSEYEELIDAARETVPGVGIAGDFIVGFPGESDEDFGASADLIRRSRYRNSFIFKYSPRPGTRAADLDDDVGEKVKRRRNRELLAVQEQVSRADNRALVGQRVEVLVEGPSPRADRPGAAKSPGATQLLGRTRTDHIVVFDGPAELAGRYVNVEIADASALTLFGRMTQG